jgi:hypothetical protein
MKTSVENKPGTTIQYVSTSKQIEVYTCSDGKKFTNEDDGRKGYLSGKEQAERHEAHYLEMCEAKKELKYISLSNTGIDEDTNEHYNEGYDQHFVFYYHENLSNKTKSALFQLVFERKHLKDLKDGWYIVEQSVYEVPSNSYCNKYSSDGYFMLLSDLVDSKEKSFNYYNNILSNLK